MFPNVFMLSGIQHVALCSPYLYCLSSAQQSNKVIKAQKIHLKKRMKQAATFPRAVKRTAAPVEETIRYKS